MKTQRHENTKSPHTVGFWREPEEISIHVGIDFGTSSTKIAYRQVGGEEKVYAPFSSSMIYPITPLTVSLH